MFQDIAPHKFISAYTGNEPSAEPSDVLLCYDNALILMNKRGEELSLPKIGDFTEEQTKQAIYLFSIDETRYFGFWRGHDIKETEDLVFQPTNYLRTAENLICFAGMEGWHLYKWYKINNFCGTCAAEMELKSDERAVICPKCGNIVYPRISPAVIIAVTSKNRLLMARNAANSTGRFGLVAGFVEFGESLEETVKREVLEEVGLHACNVKYFGSQPWPFSEAMMLGFTAEVEGDDTPHPDMQEITEAKWVAKEDLPPPLSTISIAQSLIKNFADNN